MPLSFQIFFLTSKRKIVLRTHGEADYKWIQLAVITGHY